MPLPSMKEQFAALIAAPSVSCTQPSLDQSNRAVIDLLAGDRKSTRLNSSHTATSRMPSSA